MSTTILAADGSVVEAPVDWANLTRGGAAQMFVNIELHQRLDRNTRGRAATEHRGRGGA